MSLGSKIKENRTKLNLTQQELASQIHVSRQTISNWEVERSYPDIESLILLSDMFGLSLDKLLREDVEMISNFRKKNLIEAIFISFVVCLILGGVISGIVDFTINHKFTWSLIVSSSCLFVGVFIAAFKYSKSYHLLKASFLSLIMLFLLFLAIKRYVVDLDFVVLLKISGIALLAYFLFAILIEFSRFTLWQIMAFACFVSIFINVAINLLLGEKVLELSFVISTSANVVMIGLFILIDKLKIDKGKTTKLLNRYRGYTQHKNK